MGTMSFFCMLRFNKACVTLETRDFNWRKSKASADSTSMKARLTGKEVEDWKREEVRERLGKVPNHNERMLSVGLKKEGFLPPWLATCI